MKLIIGGYAQGKLAYAKSILPGADIIDEQNAKDGSPKGAVILNHLHLLARDICANDKDLDVATKELLQLVHNYMDKADELIVISDEVGSGIVPLEKENRIWREVLGRVLVEVAKEAESVERVLCQLPQKLK